MADRLGLSNIDFVEADAKSLELGATFPVVASTAVRHELGWRDSSGSFNSFPPRSSTASDSQGKRFAATVGRHLSDDGRYVSLERLPDNAAVLEWFADLESSGLAPDLALSEVIPFRMLDEDERVPRLVAAFGPPTKLSDVGAWRSTVDNDSLAWEARFHKADDITLIAGFHADVRDEHGDGATRVYLLKLGNEAVLWQTTTRGFRAALEVATDVKRLTGTVSEMQEQFSWEPSVGTVRDLGPEDLADLRGL